MRLFSKGRYRYMSFEEMSENINTLSKDDTFINFLNKQDKNYLNDFRNDNVYKELCSQIKGWDDKEKDKYYENYFSVLIKKDFEMLFLKDNKKSNRLYFYIEKVDLSDIELYHILYRLNSGLAGMNNSNIAKTIQEKGLETYPLLSRDEIHTLLRHKGLNELSVYSIITTGLLRFPDIRKIFSKSESFSPDTKNQAMIANWVLYDIEESMPSYFKDIKSVQGYSDADLGSILAAFIDGKMPNYLDEKIKFEEKIHKLCQEVNLSCDPEFKESITMSLISQISTCSYLRMDSIAILIQSYEEKENDFIFSKMINRIRYIHTESLMEDLKVIVDYSKDHTQDKHFYSDVNSISDFIFQKRFFIPLEQQVELWNYWLEGTTIKPALLSAIICNKSTPIPHNFIMTHLHDFSKTLRDKESRESIKERPLLDAFYKNKISEEELYELLKVHLSIPENENYFRHDLLFFNNENSDFVSKVELLVSRLQKEKLSLLINSRELYTEKSLKQRI